MNRVAIGIIGIFLLLPPNVAQGQEDPTIRDSTMEKDIARCNTDTQDPDRCLSNTALTWSSSEPCDSTANPNGCRDAISSEAILECDRLGAQDRHECYMLLGTEFGYPTACEKLPPSEQAFCFGAAAVERKDPSLIEERIAAEERDIYYGTYARSTLDMSVLEKIQDNFAYDGMRAMMIMPMAIEGRLLPNDYCESLRGHYGGDYPEDAEMNLDLCQEFLVMGQHFATLETSAQKEGFMRRLQDRMEQLEQEIEEDWDDSDPFNAYKEDGLPVPEHIQRAHDLEEAPEGALVFYTGQKNELTLNVWNGGDFSLKQLNIIIEGDSTWLTVDKIVPASLDVAPFEEKPLTLTFTVANDAPDRTLQDVHITAAPKNSDRDTQIVAEFQVQIRRRTLDVSTSFQAGSKKVE